MGYFWLSAKFIASLQIWYSSSFVALGNCAFALASIVFQPFIIFLSASIVVIVLFPIPCSCRRQSLRLTTPVLYVYRLHDARGLNLFFQNYFLGLIDRLATSRRHSSRVNLLIVSPSRRIANRSAFSLAGIFTCTCSETPVSSDFGMVSGFLSCSIHPESSR